MIRFNILTLFPEMFAPLSESIMGRAEAGNAVSFNVVNIRGFSRDKHHKTDDYSFGGGQGMIFMPDPAFRALSSVGAEHTRNIYMSPRGRILDRGIAESIAREEEVTIFCGHYEGVDQRILDAWHMEEISIGDYIVTGGELPAMVLIDAAVRMIPGVLSGEASAAEESVYSGLLEYPQYTQPRSYEGMDVPEVLLSGDHKAVDLWRYEQSLRLTKERRPDLFERYLKEHGGLSKDERKVLEIVTE